LDANEHPFAQTIASNIGREPLNARLRNLSASKMRAQFGNQGSVQPVLSGYVLELRLPDDYSIPFYFEIGASPNTSIKDKFYRIDERQPAPGDWLKLRTSSQGETVLLQLSILKGDPGPTVIDERGQVTMVQPREGSQEPAEESVGSYLIGIGEVLRTFDLQRFNTKPIEIRVLIDRPETPTPLRVINKTSCMAVVGIEERLGRRYRLTLKKKYFEERLAGP
jgi:hypothetical protein